MRNSDWQAVSTPPPVVRQHATPARRRSWSGVFGILVLLAGIGVAGYYFGFYKITVEHDSGNDIYNVGLMHNRLVGVIFGTMLAFAGAILSQRKAVA